MAPAVVHCVDRVPAGSGATRCGPQRVDARALARLYGLRVRRGLDGLCRIVPAPRAQLIDRGPIVLTAASGGVSEVRVQVRNRSARTWGPASGQLGVEFQRVRDDAASRQATCQQS